VLGAVAALNCLLRLILMLLGGVDRVLLGGRGVVLVVAGALHARSVYQLSQHVVQVCALRVCLRQVLGRRWLRTRVRRCFLLFVLLVISKL